MKMFAMSAIALGGMLFALLGFTGTANAVPWGTETAAPMLEPGAFAPSGCDARAGGLTLGYLCD